MARLVLEKVAKCFSGARRERVGAVRNLDLTVEDGELLVIVGPSGCGKTTTLRLIAGLETPDAGNIFLDGKSLAGVAPEARDVAMVFQNHALFPHLTVRENLALGLRLRKFPRAEIAERVGGAAETLGLAGLLDRRPAELSGGECQRTALGRALVRRPRVFLLDEPLSNLDAPLRLQLRGEIARLRRRSGATMIFVTHDQAEAMALADRVAVMKEGALRQVARPMEIYARPASRFVAGFIGSPPMNFFEGALAARNGAVVFQERAGKGPGFCVTVTTAGGLREQAGRAVTLGLRPEHIVTAAEGDGTEVARAVLERVEPGGAESLLYYTNGNHSFVARQPGEALARVGESVALRLDMDHARFFDPDTGAAVEIVQEVCDELFSKTEELG
jgi:multiple sugar transport system ATP-binding protein